MKKIVLLGVLAVMGMLVPTRDAEACTWCAEDSPRCERANYWKCTAYPKIATCEQVRADCAWVYNAEEIGADGTLATLALGPVDLVETSSDEGIRGCHGLIVGRVPSPERVAEVRSETHRILL